MDVGAPTLLVAGLAGAVAFASPCMWPIYPVYLAYLAEPHGRPGRVADAVWCPPGGARVLFRALLFAAGFGLVFVALGATASAAGQVLRTHERGLERVSGVLMAAFGLAMAGILPAAILGRERRLRPPTDWSGPLGALVAGAAFAFAWSPCLTGPILAAILLLAGTTASLSTGTALLAAFAAGFALPLLLLAGGLGRAGGLLRRVGPALPWVVRGAGVLLVVLGVLVVVGTVLPAVGAGVGTA